MRPRSSSGQAAAEYVAALLVVGVLLAGAGATAFAASSVGERLVATVRTGLCIVGGDVCRKADAAAAGLEPCVTRERSTGYDTTLDVAVLRLGEHGEWQIALRSDGGALVTRLAERALGGTVGVGFTFSPAGLEAGADAALSAGYRGGRAWRFADATAAATFLAAAMRDPRVRDERPPDVRWDGLGGRADAEVGAAIAGLAGVGLRASTDAALGVRRDGGRRTLTVALEAEAPALGVDLPGFPAAPGRQQSIVADVTWEGGTAQELALRTATATDGRLEELTARLDLRDPVNRALAERLLVPGGVSEELRTIARRTAAVGVVERSAYVTTERRRGLSVAARLGVAIGLSHERVSAERRLVDAVAWVRGGPPQRRMDCLGV